MSTDSNKGRLKAILKYLRTPYIINIRNKQNNARVLAMKISRLGVFMTMLFVSFFLIVLIVAAIINTPLKSLLPGYLDTSARVEVIQMQMKLDSISQVTDRRDIYLENVRAILNGNIEFDSIGTMDSVVIIPVDSLPIKTEREALFANEFEEKEKYNLTNLQPLGLAQDVIFQAPVTGVIARDFDQDSKFLGVEILCANESLVTTPATGTAIAITQTINDGYEITFQHDNGYVSIFRQIDRPLCQVGIEVPQGSMVGKMASKDNPFLAPVLIYEMWYRGRVLNPEDYIKF